MKKNKKIKNKTKEIFLDSSKPSIQFEGVDLIYPDGYHALHDISFSVKQGDFVALIGPSGAGKTTILTSIPGMNRIAIGKISIGSLFVGSKTKKKHIKMIREQTSFIFQNKNVVHNQTVFQNVSSGLLENTKRLKSTFELFFTSDLKSNFPKFKQLKNIWKQTQKKNKILKAINTVGLLDLTFERVSNLSGGQEQRVALARALVTEPKVLMADEPVSALDILNAENVLNFLLKICRENGITVLINLHHVDLAIKYADKIIGLNDGRIVWEGKPENLKEENVKKIYGSDFQEINDKFIEEALIVRKLKQDKFKKRK